MGTIKYIVYRNTTLTRQALAAFARACCISLLFGICGCTSFPDAKVAVSRPVENSVARYSASVANTPDDRLLTALTDDDVAAVNAALAAGADPNSKQYMPLLQSVFMGYVDVAKVLLMHGAKADQATAYGVTPLLAAAGNGRTELVALLIEAGAPLEARNWLGSTALIAAAQSGNSDTVQVLLTNHAAIQATDRHGYSALDIAKQGNTPGYKKIVQLLETPDCAKLNCMAVNNPAIGPVQDPVNPNARTVVPPSLVTCDAAAPPATGDVDYALPDDMLPTIGTPIRLSLNAPMVAQIRIFAMNADSVIGKQTGAPNNQVLTTYPGPGLRLRPELCVSGQWHPITAQLAVTGQGQMFVSPPDDYVELSAAGEMFQPTTSNIGLTLAIQFQQPQVTVSVEAKHYCHNFVLFAEVTNYGTLSVHTSQGPYPAKTASVKVVYDGNFTAGDDNPWEPANPTRLDAFPYSGALTSTVHDASYAVVSDQNRSAGIGVSICSGFNVDAAVLLGDGRKYYTHVHTQ